MATPLPRNQAAFSLQTLLARTGGRVVGALHDPALSVVGVSTDSRAVEPGQAFVALRGERFDGHDHLQEAAARGAALAIVDRAVPAASVTLLRVEDTLSALGALGRCHLERWRAETEGRVVAITGSAGKTTTKRAIGALLEALAPGRVCVAAGNLNNLVGVPLTALALTAEHRSAVLELGTNQPGEIGALARMVTPDVAVLTLIAGAHTEGLGDIEAVAREKGALFQHLAEGGVALGNLDDERVARLLAAAPRARSYGHDERCDYRVVGRRLWRGADGMPRGSRVMVEADECYDIGVPLFGVGAALACAAALAVAETLVGDHVEGALGALERLGDDDGPGRLRARPAVGGAFVLDDSYNANPASCRASIAAAGEVAAALGRRLWLVLGEMRELGHQSLEAHRELGALTGGAHLLVTIGKEARATHEVARALGVDARWCPDADAASALVAGQVGADDVVLVKGSRGVRTERVVAALLASAGSAGAGLSKRPRSRLVAP